MTNKRLVNSGGGVDQGKDKDKVTCGDLQYKLKPGDTTWVKVRGFPWWPAMVVPENSVSGKCKPRKRTKTAILVRLYGSYEYVFMDPKKTLPEVDRVLKRHKGSHSSIIEKALAKVVPDVVSRSSMKQKKSSGGKSKQRPRNDEPDEDSMPKKSKTDNDKRKQRPQDNEPDEDYTTKKSKTDNDKRKQLPQDHEPDEDSTPKKSKTDNDKRKRLPQDHEPDEDSTPKKSKADNDKRKQLPQDHEPDEDSTPKKSKTDNDKPVSETLKHSARRLKVMQVLGLMAPSGSRFHRNGHVSPTADQEDP